MKLSKPQLSALALIIAIAAPVFLSACHGDIGEGGVIDSQVAADCKFQNNFQETAESFIARCRKAGIHGEFPSEYYPVTLGKIDRDKSARARKARKLLTNRRWIK